MSSDQAREQGRTTLARLSHAIDRGLSMIERVTIILAVTALFVIMALIFTDGAMRYAANSPLRFANDLVVLYLISAGFLLVLAYTLRHGGHISVDIFASLLPDRWQRLLSGAGFLCAAPVVGIMGFEAVKLSWDSYIHGEALIGLYAMPLWLSKAIVATGLVVLEMRLVHIGIFNLLSAIINDSDVAIRMELPIDHPTEEGI